MARVDGILHLELSPTAFERLKAARSVRQSAAWRGGAVQELVLELDGSARILRPFPRPGGASADLELEVRIDTGTHTARPTRRASAQPRIEISRTSSSAHGAANDAAEVKSHPPDVPDGSNFFTHMASQIDQMQSAVERLRKELELRRGTTPPAAGASPQDVTSTHMRLGRLTPAEKGDVVRTRFPASRTGLRSKGSFRTHAKRRGLPVAPRASSRSRSRSPEKRKPFLAGSAPSPLQGRSRLGGKFASAGERAASSTALYRRLYASPTHASTAKADARSRTTQAPTCCCRPCSCCCCR